QQQNSDLAMAHLVANEVENELNSRKEFIKACATNADLRAALQRMDKKALKDLLRQLFTKEQRTALDSLLVIDAGGRLLADDPEGSDPGTQFNWRDCFHGQGDRDPNKPLPPNLGIITQLHVSHPYISRRNRPEMTISISAPILPPGAAGPPIGVMVGR